MIYITKLDWVNICAIRKMGIFMEWGYMTSTI